MSRVGRDANIRYAGIQRGERDQDSKELKRLPRVCQRDDQVALVLSIGVAKPLRKIQTDSCHIAVFEIGRPCRDGAYPLPDRRMSTVLISSVAVYVNSLLNKTDDANAYT